MLFPLEDSETWSKKYKVSPSKGVCTNCKSQYDIDIPFADGSLRGFIMRDHGCPMNFRSVTFVVDGDDIFEIAKKLIKW